MKGKSFKEQLYPAETKAYKRWIENAAGNPIILADAGFETFLAGWQACKETLSTDGVGK